REPMQQRAFDRPMRSDDGPRAFNDRPGFDRPNGSGPVRTDRPGFDRGDRADRPARPMHDDRPAFGADRGARPGPERRPQQSGFTTFWVTWGAERGADPRRLLALVCRRGGVRGGEVGAIDVGPVGSRVEIAADRADEFLKSAQAPDAREPWIRIEKFSPKPRR
ncbi:MAG: DbpA RNA binding domain-containing protein, partial [Polyangiales bacterium]